ncbi:MAG: tetratricopeptide repeat protein [Planctomycetaceae bacterium]|nr:tetratricopeptide repeat protein [Planctomycetaceae bacterium]
MTTFAVKRTLERAIALHQAGDTSGASVLYRQILEKEPQHAEAWHLSGLIACTDGDPTDGEARIRKAIRIDPHDDRFQVNLATVLIRKKQLTEAEQLCQGVLRTTPHNTSALAGLGTSLRLQQRREEAQRVFEKAVELERSALALCNLATVMTDLGRLEEARSLLLEARDLDNHLPEVHRNLAIVLRELGKAEEAFKSLAVAESQQPDSAKSSLTKANLLLDDGQPVEAAGEYQKALAADPESTDAVFGLGCALLQTGHWSEAFEACQLAASRSPENHRFASGMLCAAALSPALNAEEVVELHRQWGRRIESMTPEESLQPDLSVDRPLRIGYVSPDLYSHATMSFLFPLLNAHDRSAFQIVLYSQSAKEDGSTRRLKNLGDEWCCTRSLSDEQFAQRMRSDRIDILIDLAGHTADNRLPVFARKPAPIQVSFLGYPHTTGLSRIDYFLTDRIRQPGDAAAAFTERPVFLPHGAACFAATDAPDTAPPPWVSNGFITLGSTHRPEKISDNVLALWSQVLQQLPDARLQIFRDSLRQESLRTQLALRLHKIGADLSRIDFSWDLPQPHYNVYRRFDILLDVLPWGSGTTAYDAMWMGVPIPTIAGDRGSCRATASLLYYAGFPELVAESAEQYISIVRSLAENRDRLIVLRHELRPAMRQTVCNAARFARDVEAALRQFWSDYLQMRNGTDGSESPGNRIPL